MNVNQKVIEFVKGLYIPKSKRSTVIQLLDYLDIVKVRKIETNDHHTIKLSVLLIFTKGKGKRETFEDYQVIYADFDNIGRKYALAYFYDSERGYPKRIDIDSPKNTIIY